MKVEYTCFAKELDTRIKGRLLVRTLTELEKKNAGGFIFAGFVASYIYMDGVLTIGIDKP